MLTDTQGIKETGWRTQRKTLVCDECGKPFNTPLYRINKQDKMFHNQNCKNLYYGKKQAKTERNKEIIKLLKEKKRVVEIANLMGISRDRVYQIKRSNS